MPQRRPHLSNTQKGRFVPLCLARPEYCNITCCSSVLKPAFSPPHSLQYLGGQSSSEGRSHYEILNAPKGKTQCNANGQHIKGFLQLKTSGKILAFIKVWRKRDLYFLKRWALHWATKSVFSYFNVLFLLCAWKWMEERNLGCNISLFNWFLLCVHTCTSISFKAG